MLLITAVSTNSIFQMVSEGQSSIRIESYWHYLVIKSLYNLMYNLSEQWVPQSYPKTVWFMYQANLLFSNLACFINTKWKKTPHHTAAALTLQRKSYLPARFLTSNLRNLSVFPGSLINLPRLPAQLLAIQL